MGPLDCCRYPSFAEILAYLDGTGDAYVVRGGKIFTERSIAQIVAACAVDPPAISGLTPDPLIIGTPATVNGSRFRPQEGTLWIGDNASFGSCVVKVAQPVSSWNNSQVGISSVTQGGLPGSPTQVYVFVETVCGAVNAVGYPTTLTVL
jgi:hypothetical protein